MAVVCRYTQGCFQFGDSTELRRGSRWVSVQFSSIFLFREGTSIQYTNLQRDLFVRVYTL